MLKIIVEAYLHTYRLQYFVSNLVQMERGVQIFYNIIV